MRQRGVGQGQSDKRKARSGLSAELGGPGGKSVGCGWSVNGVKSALSIQRTRSDLAEDIYGWSPSGCCRISCGFDSYLYRTIGTL